MPELIGTTTPWQEHPQWPERYDFAVARPPLTHLHTFNNNAVEYIAPPQRRFLGIKTPIYFTRFQFKHYYVVDNEEKAKWISRDQVIQCFHALIYNWEYLNRVVSSLKELESVARGSKLALKRWKKTVAEVIKARDQAFTAASHYGNYLSFLGDMENEGWAPRRWGEYKAPADFNPLLGECQPRFEFSIDLAEEVDLTRDSRGCFKLTGMTINNYVLHVVEFVHPDYRDSLDGADGKTILDDDSDTSTQTSTDSPVEFRDNIRNVAAQAVETLRDLGADEAAFEIATSLACRA